MKRLLLALGLALVSMVPVYATTVLYKSFDNLVQEAEGIVIGTVRSIESHYGPDQDIYTFVTLDQLEVLNGAYDQQTLTIRLKGGQVNNEILHIDGSPEFTQHERVVVFLQGNGRDIVPLVGWSQGLFRMNFDASTGQNMVYDHDGNRVLDIKKGEIVKDRTYPSEAHIVGAPYSGRRSDAEGDGNPGSTDDESPSHPMQESAR